MDSGRFSRPFDGRSSISPRVYQLAQQVYKEFDKLRQSFGESSYNTILDLNVQILEELNQLYTDKQKLDIDNNLLLSEKNDVVFQLERTKKLHNTAFKRISILEDELFGLKMSTDEDIDKLDSRWRQYEMLLRNAQEHVSRLEERETQLTTELQSTQDRYTELLRTYADRVGRIRRTDSAETLSLKTTGSVRGSWNKTRPPNFEDRIESGNRVDGKIQDSSTPEDYFTPDSSFIEILQPNDRVSSFINLLEDDTLEEGSIIAASSYCGGEEDDDDEIGMIKEVEKLIAENQDLSATKNALNVVKNDLIHKLDEVIGERQMLINELDHLRTSRNQLRSDNGKLSRQLNEAQTRLDRLITRLKLYENVDSRDDNLHKQILSASPARLTPGKRAVSVMDVASGSSTGSVYDGGLKVVCTAAASSTTRLTDPMSQSMLELNVSMKHAKLGEPRFTKREMARVIAERNYYKEELFELQEAVRCAEELRSLPHLPPHTPPHTFASRFLSRIQIAAVEISANINGWFNQLDPPVSISPPRINRSSRSPRPRNFSGNSEETADLRYMFSHLIGQASGQSAEVFLGTGNDLAASISSQSLTNAIFLSTQPNPTDAPSHPTSNTPPINTLDFSSNLHHGFV